MIPIPIDGKEVVEAIIKEIERLSPESTVTYALMLEPGYVVVFDDGLCWFTFHAPYFMPLLTRRSGSFELGDRGLDVVHAMTRQMQGIEPEGMLAEDLSCCHGDHGHRN